VNRLKLQTERIFANKKLLFAIEGTENEGSAWQMSLFESLKKLFDKIVLFDPRKHILNLGHKNSLIKFLSVVESEAPDFCIFVPARDSSGLINLEAITQINNVSPKTKTIALLGDDDTHFDYFSRYVMLFVDYALLAQHDYVKIYEKEGLGSKVFPITVVNNDLFKPLNLEKKYDVVFIGRPTAERIKFLRFLIKNGINLRVWGHNWRDYPEFKDFYGGASTNEELVIIINQSKINISFSRNDLGELHYKGRVFEVAACNAFQLVEYFEGYSDFFSKNQDVFFKDEFELLRKIKYYIKKDSERKIIALQLYAAMLKKYDLLAELEVFFRNIIKDKTHFCRDLPDSQKKVVSIPKHWLNFKEDIIRSKILDADCISFYDVGDEVFEFKNLLQAQSIIKTGKDMSCCGYYISSAQFGDYLLFRSNICLIGENAFNSVLDLTQLMVSKDYFFKNLEKFKQFYLGNRIELVNKKNSAFIDIPLFRTEQLKKSADYRSMENAFKGGCLFLITLQSLINKRQIFFSVYPYKLLFIPLLNGNFFVLKYLVKSLFDVRYWNRIFGSVSDFAETS